MTVLQDEVKTAANPQQRQIAAMKLQKLFKDNDIRPGRMLGNVAITLVPSLFSFFAVRRFCTADPAIPGMVAGGAGSLGWIGDLTAADPTFVLPAVAFVAFQAQMTVRTSPPLLML
jgi:membrane protein insertase Oxa1/YidC/SpoIIIJ